MDAEIPGRRFPVAAGVFDRRPDRLSVERVVGGPNIGPPGVRNQILGKVGDADRAVTADDERPFDDVFELADIARPVPGHEKRESLPVHPLDGFALKAVEPLDELGRKQRDVFFALAQEKGLLD